MPNNPFNFNIPQVQTHITSSVPKLGASLGALIKMQQAEAVAAARAARAAMAGGGGRGRIPQEGDPRYGMYVDVPQKDGVKKPRWVWGTNAKERAAAAAKAITDASNDIIAGDEALQKDLANFERLSVPGRKEVLDKVRQTHAPRLAQILGVSGEELSKQLTTGLDQSIKAREKAINAAGLGTQLLDAGKTIVRRGVDAIGSFFDSSAEKLARGHAAEEAEKQALKDNAYRDEIARMQAEGRSTIGFQLSNYGRSAIMHGGSLAAMIAPAVVGGAVAGVPGAIAGGAAGAGLMSRAEALERVAGDPNLTEQQKLETIAPTAALSGGISAALGAIPIGPANLMRPALVRHALSKQVAKKGIPEAVASKMLPEATEAETKAATAAWINAQAGTVLRPGPYTPNLYQSIGGHAVNAGALGGAFQLGSNAAYGMGTGQDVPLTEDLGEAVLGGAVLGLPFGVGGRLRAWKTGRTVGADPNLRTDLNKLPGTIYAPQPRYDVPVEAPPTGPWENPTLPRTFYPESRILAPDTTYLPGLWDDIFSRRQSPTTVEDIRRAQQKAVEAELRRQSLFNNPTDNPAPRQNTTIRSERSLAERGGVPLFDSPNPDPMGVLNRKRTGRVTPDEELANGEFLRTKPDFGAVLERVESLQSAPAVENLVKRAIEERLISRAEAETLASPNRPEHYNAVQQAVATAKEPSKILSAEDKLFAANPGYSEIYNYIDNSDSSKAYKSAASVIKRALLENRISPDEAEIMAQNFAAVRKTADKAKEVKGIRQGIKAAEAAQAERAMQEVDNARESAYWTSAGREQAARVEPARQSGTGRTATENFATNSTVSGNTETVTSTTPNTNIAETSASRTTVEGRRNAGPAAPDTRQAETPPAVAPDEGTEGTESAIREPSPESATTRNATGSEGTGEPKPAPEQRARNADDAEPSNEPNVNLEPSNKPNVNLETPPETSTSLMGRHVSMEELAQSTKKSAVFTNIIQEKLAVNELSPKEVRDYIDSAKVKWKKNAATKALELYEAKQNAPATLIGANETQTKSAKKLVQAEAREALLKNGAPEYWVNGILKKSNWKKLKNTLLTTGTRLSEKTQKLLDELAAPDKAKREAAPKKTVVVKQETIKPQIQILPDDGKPFTEKTYTITRKNLTPLLVEKLKRTNLTKEQARDYIATESWDTIKERLNRTRQLDPDLDNKLKRLAAYRDRDLVEAEQEVAKIESAVEEAVKDPTPEKLEAAKQVIDAADPALEKVQNVRAVLEEHAKPESEPVSEEYTKYQDSKLNEYYEEGVYAAQLDKLWDEINTKMKKLPPQESSTEDTFIKAALGMKLTKKEQALYKSAISQGVQPLMLNKEAVEEAVRVAHERGFENYTALDAVKQMPSESAAELNTKIWC